MNIRDDFILKDIHEGYLVGGYIRDYILGKGINDLKDRDIAIKGAEEFTKKLAVKLDATFITLDSENKIYRLVLKDKENYLDISELCGNTIEEDLIRRDFTINAIAYDLKENRFIDVTGGIDDIKNKCINAIREENFTDDPLRILRAFRFMATTGFGINKELENILIKHKNLLHLPSKERIRDEIMKLFGGRGKCTSETLIKMLDMGILELIFPCVNDIKKIPSNSHHHLDLIHHVIETVRQIELFYEEVSATTPNLPQRERISLLPEIKNHLDKIDFGGYPRINHLKLAGFLHDIGKPSTWTIEESGRHRFIGHDLEGEKLVKLLLKNLKFSNKQIDYISKMVRYHIYPSNVIVSPNLDNKIMMRYIRKMGDNVIDNIILAKADRLSAQGEAVTHEMTEQNLSGLDKLLNFYLKVKPTLKPLPKLLDGVEIMQISGLKQSPALGKIIKELHEAQLNGDINTKEEAVIFVNSLCK